MSRIACPDVCDWQALLEGDRSEDQIDSLAHHLETCGDCRQTLESLAAVPAGWEDTARDLDGPPRNTGQEPALRHVVEQLKGEVPLGGEEDLSFLQPADNTDLLGILGPYQVQEVIGRGGMGVVLKAFDPTLHRLVAIKVLDPSLAGNATARRRFTRETQAAAAVCHEHVVAVHGVSESGGLPYLVMQYVAGESLQERIDRSGPLEVTEIVRIGLQTASGLAAAHAQGLIHRDIKPANLLLENGLSRVKITDFGLARMADDVGLTQNGVVAGTPEYMAPEQACAGVVDHRADLFSLGSVLYACCTGLPPFRGSTALAVLSLVSEKEPAPIRSLNPEVPVWLDAFIARLMAKDPAQRFQTAAEVAALLEGYLAHLCQPAMVSAPNFRSLPIGAAITSAVLPARTSIAPRLQQSLWVAAVALLTALGGEWIARQFAGGAGQSEKQAKEWYFDFRGRPTPADLAPFGFGDEEARFIHAEPEGLRISLPQTWIHPWGGVGFQTASEFGGDFEITTTFEIINSDIPRSGYGVGARLRIKKADPSPEGATFCRLARNGNKQIVLWDRGIEQPDGKIWTQEGDETCTENVVRLRLKRTGNILHYSWASGAKGDDFQEIHMCKFGAEDIKYVQIGVVTGRQPCAANIRFMDLRIRGSVGASTGGASGRASRGNLWFVALLFLGLLLSFAAILGVRRYVRRRHPFENTTASGPTQDKPSQLEKSSTFASFSCSRCGKRLQAKASLAGKKVKCPHCGEAVLVPSIQTGNNRYFLQRRGLTVLGLFALLGLGIAVVAWLPGAGSPAVVSTGYEQSFRGGPEGPPDWERFGPGAAEEARFEPNGLRITLPAGCPKTTGTGVRSTFGVKGDFDITVAFEILQESPPAELNKKTRFTLAVLLDRQGFNMASIARALRQQKAVNGQLQPRSDFQTWVTLWDEPTGKSKERFNFVPTEAKTGRLRLERRGSLLSFYASEGRDGEFVLLQQYPFGDEDVKDIRLCGATDDNLQGSLDVRVSDFSLRILPRASSTSASEPERKPGLKKWQAALGIMILLVLAPIVVYLVVRRFRRPGSSLSPAPMCFPCSACGKELRAKAALAGKKVKCPHCGEAVFVPSIQAGNHKRFLQHYVLPALGLFAVLGLGVAFWFAVDSSEMGPKDEDAEVAAGAREVRANFHQDLRSADLENSILQPIGESVRSEAAGVRVTLPAGKDVAPPAGLKTNVTIQGDFEITGSFEILQADRPSTGFGVGVSLYAAIDPNTNDAVSLAHRLMPDGTTVFVSNRMTPQKDGLKNNVKTLPSRATAGKLRIQRIGPIIRFLVAEGDQSEFIQVDEVEFGTADVHYVQFGGNTGGSRSGLDLRLLDFAVRAEKLKNKEDVSLDTSAADLPMPGAKGRLAAVILGLLAVVAFLGAWLWARRPNPPAAAPPFAAPTVSFSCASCGKRLEVKAELTGKKGKCPQCGKVTAIPAADAYRGG